MLSMRRRVTVVILCVCLFVCSFLISRTTAVVIKTNVLVYNSLQVIKNIRNVTRHRNGRSVKSRQTRWKLDFVSLHKLIMHSHDVASFYSYISITYFFVCFHIEYYS